MFWLNEEIYSMEVCIVVFVGKLDIFSFHLLHRSLCKSKKIKRHYQLNLTWLCYFCTFKNDTEFRRDLASHFIPVMLESLVVPNRPRPFWKEEWWCFLTLPFSLRVSHNKTGCSQVKNFILLNCWKFWKNFQKRKISLRQNFFFFHAVQFVFSINVVLQYYLHNSILRVASKISVGIDV